MNTAANTYCGRSFALARAAADKIGGDLYVVSAGLGLVHGEDRIPPYSLTVAPGSPDSILDKITEAMSVDAWWERGAQRSPFNRGLTHTLEGGASGNELILLALSANYLQMVQGDLLRLAPEAFKQLRIFGAGTTAMNPRLHTAFMPYDGRLDGSDSPIPGTQTDFASRALADFVDNILPQFPSGGHADHRVAVLERLDGRRYRETPERERQSDAEILDLLRKNWRGPGTSASRMLRVFRDELGTACEQGRFRDLFAQVKGQMEGAG